MIDYNIYRVTPLREEQHEEYIETAILSILKENKLSLSQVRCIFNHIIAKIEDKNLVNL